MDNSNQDHLIGNMIHASESINGRPEIIAYLEGSRMRSAYKRFFDRSGTEAAIAVSDDSSDKGTEFARAKFSIGGHLVLLETSQARMVTLVKTFNTSMDGHFVNDKLAACLMAVLADMPPPYLCYFMKAFSVLSVNEGRRSVQSQVRSLLGIDD